MKLRIFWTGALAFFVLLALAQAAVPPNPSDDVARGRYLVAYGECNSCHTPGWIENDGTVPVSRWLTGAAIGFRGPWGTIYPTNVRLRFQQISEAEWLFMIRTRGGHPPMKWTDLRMLTADDQRAIYRFIHSLGGAGVPAPDDLTPSVVPKTPYYDVVPQNANGSSPP